MEIHFEWQAGQKQWGFHVGLGENGIDIDSQDGGVTINEDDTRLAQQQRKY